MDTSKKRTFTVGEVEKNVFIINDIDLMIPPSQIEVRKEDLTYRYRTLRTKQSTKVPTGNGQNSVKLTIPFTDDQLLQLHRLLIETRSSPFCYVDNRYLRESLVSDWPYSQNMAFTITGVNLSNMPNASNAYVLEADLVWFNYFPYMHNYLFREDWQTNWLRTKETNTKVFQTNTIGWKLNKDTYQRIYGANVIGEVVMSGDEVLARRGLRELGEGSTSDFWSNIQDRHVEGSARRTIYEMEMKHPGVEFDLLPTPGNMMRANIVNQPRYSRIYVRYMNFLQRDALWKNFQIDVEQDILDYEKNTNSTGLYNSVFRVGESPEGLPVVISLASGQIPLSLRRKWIKEMVKHNNGVNLHFHAYKEIRLPQKWTDHVENKKNKVVADLFARIQGIRESVVAKQSTGVGMEEAIPVLGRKYPITSHYGHRIHPVSQQQHFHTGTDFGAPRGTPILAPESGYIVHIGRENTHAGNYVKLRTVNGDEWWFLHMDIIDPRTQTAYQSYLDNPDRAITVPVGRQLGTVGESGRVTGAHLHLEFRQGGAHTDPLYKLQTLLVDQNTEEEVIDEEPFFDYSDVPNQVELTDEEFTLLAAKEEAQQKLELTPDETEAITELMGVLDSEGWSYYDEDSTVTNVWKKLFSLQISHTGRDFLSNAEYPREFVQKGIVLTGVSGGYQHLVSRIPVLSHEFPTQQHLGSMEPEYMFEFAVVDDQSDLEGISTMGQLVQGMRSLLQSNSRKFRPIVDGWCLAVDTFITRILGTYNENDFRVWEQDGKIGHAVLKKRAIINNTYDATVPGNPGLSVLTMNIQETNPYELEVLTSTSPTLVEKEKARGQVLRAVKNLELAPEYKDILIPLFFANKAGANLTDSSRPDYGKFGIPKKFGGLTLDTLESELFSYDPAGKFLLQSNGPQDQIFLQRIGIQNEYYSEDRELLSLDPSGLDSYYVGILDYKLGEGPYLYQSVTDDPSILEAQDIESLSTLINPEGKPLLLYDISSLLDSQPVLASIPVDKLMEYYLLVEATIHTGNRLLGEEALGGMAEERIKEELYQLPVSGEQWRSWLMYLEEFVKRSNTSTPDSALTQVKEIARRSFEEASKGRTIAPLPEWKRPAFAAMAEQGYGIGGTKTAGAWDYMAFVSNNVSTGRTAIFSSDATVVANQRNSHETALSRLVSRYMNNFPIQLWLPDKLKETYKYAFGDLLAEELQKNEATVDSFDKKFSAVHDALYVNAYSVGNITSYGLANKTSLHAGVYRTPVWEYSTQDTEGKFRTYHSGLGGVAEQVATGIDQSLPVSLLHTASGGYFVHNTSSVIKNTTGVNPVDLNSETVFVELPTIQKIQNAATNQLFNLFPSLRDTLYSPETVGAPLGSNFKFPIDHSVEEQKLMFVKGSFDKIADNILGDYRVLELLGLEHLLIREGVSDEFTGKECYPDLDLPAHPYYGSNIYTHPDFYFWNIYEDADALNPEVLNSIQEQVNYVVQNAYNSMKRLSSGDEKYDERAEAAIQETGVADPIQISTQLNPEGTDAQRDGSGPTDSLYAPTKDASAASKDWNERAKARGGVASRVYGTQPKDYLEGIRLSNAEGLYGVGGGLHYPKRVGDATYGQLKEMFDKTTAIFGSRQGYLGQELDEKNAPDIVSATKNTNLSKPVETAHTFDVESLKLLARDSSKDLISQKMTMKRAFPTFKLFFIEEDEFESRFINFDDFYAYNAIKRIEVVQSRKLATDVAVIQLQNIAGTLDGTKRNIVVDLDYATGVADDKLRANDDTRSSMLADDPVTAGTTSEQPFGAVVLRPGLNVQLRMGYSNDPSSLHVMLSGRVVDVVWNKTGDLAEITVQSFGSELTQVIKGNMRDENSRTYYTTHELLGAMMLEPEVVHFGRWEFGQKFMIGEAKDYRLDFTDYSRDGYLGRLPVTSWVSRWIVDHPVLATGAAIGAGLIGTFFPYGRMASWFGAQAGGQGAYSLAKGIGNIAARGGSAAPYIQNTGGYVSMGQRLIQAAGTSADDFLLKGGAANSGRVALLREAFGNIDELAKVARNKLSGNAQGLKEFNEILVAKKHAAESAMLRANSLDEAAQAAATVEKYVQGVVGKSRWFAKPWIELSGATFISSLGFKPIGSLLNFYVGTPLAIAGVAFGTALAVDAIINSIYAVLSQTRIDAIRKFFARTKVQMFLTPQDDNLYPPHPKDYMSLDRALMRKVADYGLHVGSMIISRSDALGKSVGRFFFPDELISKKVDPEACRYQIVSSTIWDIFHEMSLRHPGWIYGTRPYGNDFRYTMFFGVPAQRYWARPASDGFILRANDLRRYLDSYNTGSEYPITENEFITLYGREAYEEIKELSLNEVLPPESKTGLHYPQWDVPATSDNEFGLPPQSSIEDDLQLIQEAEADEQIRKALLQQNMAALALKEYLRAVQIRFEPFRRYHLLTSDRDIVWNGLMGSENAVVNAVDVSYFTDTDHIAHDTAGTVQTAIFKAHAFIPEHKLRISPVRWYNCKGYGMAQRYAMGELLHSLKDMYRGEILVLGNPRIRPWDVGIILDDYNDMVGPVEVEQVVHMFSHETGYLTEIKPSALCFANEISGFPLIEAMKLFSMAVNDVHKRFTGVTGDTQTPTSGNLSTIAAVGNVLGDLPGEKAEAMAGAALGSSLGFTAARANKSASSTIYDTYIDEKYRKLFPEGASLKNMYGSAPPPKFETIDGIVEDMLSWTKLGAGGIGAMGAALTLAGGATTAGTLLYSGLDLLGDDVANVATGQQRELISAGKIFMKNPLALAAGAALLTVGVGLGSAGTLSALAINQLQWPGTAFLFGGTALFLQCLRNDAIIVVPLIKNGHPIIAGLGQNDPAMLWNTIRGTINRTVHDSIEGTTDMLSLYKRYFDTLWERAGDVDLFGADDVVLTGEPQ